MTDLERSVLEAAVTWREAERAVYSAVDAGHINIIAEVTRKSNALTRLETLLDEYISERGG